MKSSACCITRSRTALQLTTCALFLLPKLQLSAETSLSGYTQLEAATKATSLLYADKPWHLKLQVELYDTKGLLSEQGTIERWESGDDSRTVSFFGASTRTVIERGGQVYREMQGESVPQPAAALLRAVLHPGPYPKEMAGTNPEARNKSLSKVPMTCVMLSRPLARGKETPLGVFPTYCLTSAGELEVIYNFGSDLIVRNQIGKFQGLDVTVGAVMMQGERVIARSKLVALNVYEPKPDDFEPTKEMAATSLFTRISGGVLAGNKVTGAQPVYPVSARQARLSGTVVLEATIGSDGHIHSLIPVSGPDPDLVIASLAAVRTWEYKPYLLNGVPTEVTTTITVNFNINQR